MESLLLNSLNLDWIALLLPAIGMGAITVGGDATTWAGDVTGETDLDKAIPELWASAIWGYFEKALVLRPLCDDYSALVKGKGDAINIPTLPEVTGQTDKAEGTMVVYGDETLVDTNILINKHKYVAKMFEDLGVIQANESLFAKYAQGMAYQLALQVDTDIMAELDAGLGATHTLATADNTLTPADAESVVSTLLSNNLPLSECVWVLNPPTYADLLAQGLLDGQASATVGMNFNSPTVQTGAVPSFFGMPVVQSSLIATTAGTGNEIGYCFHKGAVAIAMQQEIRVQSEYSVDFLATKVVADCIYGVKRMTENKTMGVEILQN